MNPHLCLARGLSSSSNRRGGAGAVHFIEFSEAGQSVDPLFPHATLGAPLNLAQPDKNPRSDTEISVKRPSAQLGHLHPTTQHRTLQPR